MQMTEELPTIFAMTLGEKFGLLLDRVEDLDYQRYNELVEKMRYFQQMAVSSSFEDCVMVYFGARLAGKKGKNKKRDLNKKQLEVLKLIYRSTIPWMTGHIVGVCMKRINSVRTQNRDFSESVRVLVEQLGEDAGVSTKKIQGIIVKSTQTEKEARKKAKKKK